MITTFCAAGAISSECQRVRRRRSSLKSLLRELIGWLRTHFFELLARGEPFSRFKTGIRKAPIGQKSCPLFVCLSSKNNRALLDQVDGAEHRKYTKKPLKKGLLERVWAPNPDTFRTPIAIVHIFGRRPSPAAQPAPRVHSSYYNMSVIF